MAEQIRRVEDAFQHKLLASQGIGNIHYAENPLNPGEIIFRTEGNLSLSQKTGAHIAISEHFQSRRLPAKSFVHWNDLIEPHRGIVLGALLERPHKTGSRHQHRK
jgi:hypothetical protein